MRTPARRVDFSRRRWLPLIIENVESYLATVLNQPNLHILIWEEDGTFIAKCLDIPGCISEGSTRSEALRNIRDAINLCLSVIREDASKPHIDMPEVELVEVPTTEFLQAP